MEHTLVSMEAAPYFLMHLLGAPNASGVIFLVRRGHEFRLLPFFPCQGTRRPEEDLHSDAEVVNALLELVALDWEIVGRLQVDFTATRAGAPFWADTIDQLAQLQSAWQAPRPALRKGQPSAWV